MDDTQEIQAIREEIELARALTALYLAIKLDVTGATAASDRPEPDAPERG